MRMTMMNNELIKNLIRFFDEPFHHSNFTNLLKFCHNKSKLNLASLTMSILATHKFVQLHGHI